jgi:uncharacterized protein YyaL (SSP411 family)
MPQMLVALSFYLQKPKQIILSGRLDDPNMMALRRTIYRPYLPNKIVLHAAPELASQLEFLQNIIAHHGERPTAFVCIDYACQLPTHESEVLARLLQS